MRRVLHVGCGPKTLAGMPPFFQDGTWSEIRLDIDPTVMPDVVGTMTDMSAVADQTVDAVFSSHNIEHLFAHEVPIALSEFRRVLSPAGFVLITCPDLQSVSERIAKDELLETAYQSGKGPIAPLDILYGHRHSIASGNHFMAHRCGFTMRVLRDVLLSKGFRNVVVMRRPEAFDLWALGTMNAMPEDELKQRAATLFPAQIA